MKRFFRGTLLVAFALALFFCSYVVTNAPQLLFGQQASFIVLTGSGDKYIKPVGSLWGLQWPGLATSTTGCLSVRTGGWIFPSGSPCGSGSGTVTSVAMTVPTGLTIAGSPITGAGTLAVSFTSGYSIPKTASTTNWNTFYDTPSGRITPGTNLSWSGNTLNGAADSHYLGLFSGTYPITFDSGTGAIGTALASTTLKQSYGTAQIGALTIATSSDTNIQLNVTNSSGTFTFNPVFTGTLADSRIASAATWNAKESALTFSFPLIRTTNAISFGGLSTTTNLTTGAIPYVTGVNTFGQVATTTLTASSPLSLSNPIVVIGASPSALTLSTAGTWSGLAGTATALAANGANCVGQFPLGVDASGAVETCTSAVLSLTQNGGGTAQTGAITFGTTTNTTNGVTSKLNIINSGGTFTFGSDQSGTLTVAGGGTGATSLTGLLQGNGTSAFTAVTGTAGQFPYYNGTNTLLATSTLFLSAADNVGIGTTTPWAKFSIDTSNLAANLPEFAIGSSARTDLLVNQAGKFAFGASSFPMTESYQFTFTDSGGTQTGLGIRNLSSVGFSGMEYYDQDASLGVFMGFRNSTHEMRLNNVATTPSFNFLLSSASRFYIASNNSVAVGSTTPVATFQVTSSDANATTSLQLGKPGQNKGTCLTYYDTAGTPVYGFIAAGATAFTYTATKPSGCQN
jgi:hypothetical protein